MFVQTEERVQMKKLMFFAVVAMIGASAFASGNWPRVYQYSATLNTAVAKNAAKVSYVCEGEKMTAEDICYRVKGSVSLKGVVVFDCGCVNEDSDFADGYPMILMASSADKYTEVDIADAGMVWAANRLGSPVSSKAKVAELGFMLETGFGGDCGRTYVLGHAGFGTAGTVISGEGLDILTISGGVVGMATAPYCSADGNNCPRCLGDDDCEYAVAFEPCTGIGEYADCGTGQNKGSELGVAYGTFTLKYNRTLAIAIKDIAVEDICETAAVLVPKVFGRNAVNPYGDCDETP
jgi:hypothetical protein